MACFDEFLGVRDCNISWTPKSGLYIDDLAGISVDSAANIASDSSGLNLLLDRISFASKLVAEEALSMIPNVDFTQNADYLNRGCFGTTAQASEAVEKGITFEKTTVSPLSQLVVNTIYIKSAVSVSNKIVRLLDNGTEVQTWTIDIVADEEYIIDNVNYIAQSNKVEIVMDNSDMQPYIAQSRQNRWDSCNDCNDCRRCYNSPYLTVSDGIGITAELLIQCSPEKAMCKILYSLRYAILYKSGVLVMEEFLASDRLNFLTIHSKEWAEEKRKEWEAEYIDKVNAAMRNVRYVLPKIDRHCATCKDFEVGFVSGF